MAKVNKPESIYKTGPQTYRDLQKANQEAYTRASQVSEFANIRPNVNFSRPLDFVYEGYEKSPLLQQGNGDYWGNSMWDKDTATEEEWQNLNEVRAQEQPWWAQVGAGIAKGTVLAGTTFLDGTIGLLFGLGQGIANLTDDDPNTGFWSGFWDNDFSKAMQSVNEASESALPNYYTEKELNSPWYENIFTANFIGDKFIKNLGFSIGALYSGGVWAAPLKTARVANFINAVARTSKAAPMVNTAVGGVLGAFNEARVEAVNNSKDWQELQIQKLDDNYRLILNDKYKPSMDALRAEYEQALLEFDATKGKLQQVRTPEGIMTVDPAAQKYQAKVKALDAKRAAIESDMERAWAGRQNDKVYQSTMGKIVEDRIKMGNMDMLMNMPILTASNIFQFAKFYSRGFNTARRSGVRTVTDEVTGATRYVAKGMTKTRAAIAATKGALAEGTEEISQKAGSVISGNYYSKDVNNFYRSQIDKDAEQETLDWLREISSGINETVNDGSSWEEFFIGALTGALGIPTFRSTKAADGSRRSPITLEGGIREHVREAREQAQRSEEIANYLNSRVQSPEFLNYYRGLIRHTKYARDKERAIEEDNKFDFENADHAQLVSDIIMFDNGGKLNDLIEMIESAYDTSDGNIDTIIKNTISDRKNGAKSGPFVDSNGNPFSRDEIIEALTKSRNEIIGTIESYRKAKNELDTRTGGRLNDEQLSELTWMQTQIDNWQQRASQMTPLVKKALNDLASNLENYAINIFSEENTVEEIEGASKVLDSLGIGEKTLEQLRQLIQMTDKKLQAVLTSPKNIKWVDQLIDNIDTFGSDFISGLDKSNVVKMMRDLSKIGEGTSTYQEKLDEYLKDPSKVAEDQARTTETAAEEINNEKTINTKEALTKAQSVYELKEALRNAEEGVDTEAILKEMEDEGNLVVKDYREISAYDKEVQKALSELGEDSETMQDALSLWSTHKDSAERLEQIANPASITLNDEHAFLEDSEGDMDLADSRFQNARFTIQRAMSKVNNDTRFKERFSDEYRKPADEPVRGKGKGIDKDSTGDSDTSTIPHVNPDATPTETLSVPVGNVTAEMVAAENRDANRIVETQRSLDQRQQGQRKYYRPAVPELHIEASKEGDFRPFDVVVAEREPNVDFSDIYNYLRDNGAFSYVNAAKIKPGDTLGFMIDPDFNDHTIFLVDTRNNQIVGSIDESDVSVARYEGLAEVIKKVRDEYQVSRQSDTVGGSPVALSYLLENGAGTIESAGYFLHGVAAAFPAITNSIESIRNSIDKETLGMKPDAFASSDNPSISQIEDLIKEYYGEDGVIIYKELLNNATGFVPAEGTKVEARLEKLVPIKEAPTTRNTGRFFATPQTRVSKMMVGRIPYGTEDRSLADIPGVLDGEAKPMLGIIKNGTLTTNEKIDDRLIIKPVDMAQKEGRLYLLIPNAAGTYSPAAVRVKHFNNQEFNLDDATVANTPIGQGINSALDKLSEATSQDDVSIAMKELASDIYMQDVMVTWFDAKAGSGIVISRKVRKPDGTYEMVNINGQEQIKENKYTIYYQSSKRTIDINGLEYTYEAAKESGVDMSLFGQPRDITEIRRDILNTILGFNLPIQVSASRINDSGYNNRVIKSNVLTSNLREAKVIGSWFTTDYFDKQGNLQRSVSPSSVKPAPSRRTTTPVGGTEGVIQGTPVRIGNSTYTVDLKTMVYTDSKGAKYAATTSNANIFAMAWAQENFGDSTESSVMTENKVITPQGRVLDRNTGTYVSDAEAKRIKDKIAGRNQAAQNRIAESKRVIADIYENQKKVDKTRTDSDYYYVLEDDGQYHEYSRVHSRLGDNWLGERTETENSRRALEAGTAVDKVIRDFFTSKETPVRPETLSESAFIDLISKLTEIKSKMEQMGESFMADNIVLFQKYADGTRVAGEVDILSVDKDGNFKIYDVKTSRYSFGGRYFTEKSSKQRMSTKDYYTLQLSAYQNLFESQYGVRPTRIAILPFVLTYGTSSESTVYSDLGSGKKSLGLPVRSNTPYFRVDRKTSDEDARFEMVNRGGKTIFIPKVTTEALKNTLKGTDAYRLAIEIVGGDPKEATDFIVIEPGEAVIDSHYLRLNITKKAKVFAVTPTVKYTGSSKAVVTAISKEEGIPLTYNSAVNVPLASTVRVPSVDNTLPIFDSTIETMITKKDQDRVLPENAFEEGGEIGYYEKDGKLYSGYLKKIGEVEVTLGSGQKVSFPIHVTKVRDRGFGREGEFGSTSEYLTVFENGKAISTRTNSASDAEAAATIMEALTAKPDKVAALSSEKTQIHNPRTLEELDADIRNAQYSQPQAPTQPSGASRAIQREDTINKKPAKRTRHKLRATDGTRPTWNREKELSWLEQVLPQLSEQDRVRVVKGLIQVADNGPVAWGMFSDGIITLSDIAAEGTTYHEAFHAVFNLMLTSKEREALFDEAKQLYGTDANLEEEMAEGFREYVVSQENRGLGRKILDFFKNLFAKVTNWKYVKPSLTSYYRMINQGKYAKVNLPTLQTSTKSETSFESLSSETRQALEAKGWTKEKFDSISQRERDQAVECVGL